jgi:hypothetical protein
MLRRIHMMPSTKDLVLKTATHIEKSPRCYRYTSNRIPQCSDDVGCILGWMAHISAEHDCGVLTPEAIARMTCDPLYACNVGYNDFFKRLDECYPLYRGHWRSDATHAVAALRAYAARYPEAPGLPPWARMRDREAAASRRYAQFRATLDLGPRNLFIGLPALPAGRKVDSRPVRETCSSSHHRPKHIPSAARNTAIP